MAPTHFLFLIFICLLGAETECLKTVTIKNNCNTTIWPGLLEDFPEEGNLLRPQPPDNNQEQLELKGFELKPGESFNITAPVGWQGIIWGRNGCSFNTSNSVCATGDCGKNLKCDTSPTLPFTAAALLLNKSSDHYMVSLFYGYNMPMSVLPYGDKNSSECKIADCQQNINKICPSERQVRYSEKVVGCRGDCQALRDIEYCCIGSVNYLTNSTCKASQFTTAVNHACPRATINGFNAKQSLFQCIGSAANYVVSFC